MVESIFVHVFHITLHSHTYPHKQIFIVNSLLGGIRQKSDVIKGFASSFNDVMKGSFSLSEERMNEGGEYDDDGDDDDGEEEEEEGVYGNDYQCMHALSFLI